MTTSTPRAGRRTRSTGRARTTPRAALIVMATGASAATAAGWAGLNGRSPRPMSKLPSREGAIGMGFDNENKVTLSGRLPEEWGSGAPAPIDPATGMHKDYWVLSAEERAKGFVRPVRR